MYGNSEYVQGGGFVDTVTSTFNNSLSWCMNNKLMCGLIIGLIVVLIWAITATVFANKDGFAYNQGYTQYMSERGGVGHERSNDMQDAAFARSLAGRDAFVGGRETPYDGNPSDYIMLQNNSDNTIMSAYGKMRQKRTQRGESLKDFPTLEEFSKTFNTMKNVDGYSNSNKQSLEDLVPY